MVSNESRIGEVNVLASGAGWGWPEALRRIFQPRGVNLLVAESTGDFVDIIKQKRIQAAIVDFEGGGLATLKVIRMDYPRLPCILLSNEPGEAVLREALGLEVFSVIDKPVNMGILREQLHRLFIKKYNNGNFAE